MAEDVPPLSNLPQSAEKSPALAMLSPMTTGLTADISASAVVNNINTLRDRLGDGVKLCAGIKADYKLFNTTTPLELALSEYLYRRSRMG